MSRKCIFVGASLILFSLAAWSDLQAQGFGLADMLAATDDSAEVEVHAAGGVVTAQDMGSAARQAHAQLLGNSGVRFLATASGTGVLATGQSGYNTYENINATLLSKRAAYQRAATQAKRFLLDFFQGPDLACEAATSEFLVAVDSASEGLANLLTLDDEECRSTIAGSINGYVTYAIDDDVDARSVSVTLISTPRTRSGITAASGALIVSTEPAEVFNMILADLTSGVVSPVGARLIVNPVTGENVMIGFGGAIRRQNSNPNVQRRLSQAADDQARLRAQAALLGTLRGEQVYWSGGFNESQIEGTEQFESDPTLEAEEMVRVLDEERSTFLNVLSTQDEYRLVQAGQLPPGVSTRDFASDDGYWSFAVAVYSPSLGSEALRAAEEMRSGRAPGTPGAVSGPQTRALQMGGPSETGENPRGPRGRVSDPDDL